MFLYLEYQGELWFLGLGLGDWGIGLFFLQVFLGVVSIIIMYQNKIEKFTDRLFLKSATTRSPITNLSLNFKTLSPKQPAQQASPPKSVQRSHFRHSKQELGLSKTDIDKLELMCSELTAEDYLNKLIKIHEEEKAMKDQLEIFQIGGKGWADGNFQDRNFSQGKKSQSQLLPETIKDIDTVKDDVGLQNSQIKIQIKPEITDHKDEKAQRKPTSLKKSSIVPDKAPQTKQFVFVNKSPKKQTYTKKTQQKQKQQKKSPTKEEDARQPQPAKQTLQIPSTTSSNLRSSVKSMKVGTSCPSLEIDQLYNIQAKNSPKINDQVAEHQDRDRVKLSHKQFEEKEVSNAKKLQEICYTEIGKRMVVVHEKQVQRQFFKTNLHIRSYIMKNIISYVQNFAQSSPNSVFIFPNERAIHYQASQKPTILQNHIQHTKYVQIIKSVNHIIQKNIFKQKYQQKTQSSWPYVMLAMFLLLMVMLGLIVFVGENSTQLNSIFIVCTGLLVCVMMVVLIAHSLHCYSKKINFVPVCEIICQDIDSYFKFVNGKMENNLEWIVGESFFWLEVKIHENGYAADSKPKHKNPKGRNRPRGSIQFNYQNYEQQQ